MFAICIKSSSQFTLKSIHSSLPVTRVDEEDNRINGWEVVLPHATRLVVTAKIECGESARRGNNDYSGIQQDYSERHYQHFPQVPSLKRLRHWPDPVNAELLRGGVQGGHMLSHPVILVERIVSRRRERTSILSKAASLHTLLSFLLTAGVFHSLWHQHKYISAREWDTEFKINTQSVLSYIQGVFFNWSYPKNHKYGKKLKYQNWSPPPSNLQLWCCP